MRFIREVYRQTYRSGSNNLYKSTASASATESEVSRTDSEEETVDQTANLRTKCKIKTFSQDLCL